MTGFEWYLLFSLTTAFVSVYELFLPVISELKLTHSHINAIDYGYVTIFVLFLLAFTFAPLLLLSCLVPSFGDRFRASLTNTLKEAV